MFQQDAWCWELRRNNHGKYSMRWNRIMRFVSFETFVKLLIGLFEVFQWLFRQKSVSPLESKSRNYCESNKKSMEIDTVQWRGNSYNLWDPWSQLFWSWRTEWNVCKSSVSWSISYVSRLCSKHKSHGWSNNSQVNCSYNEAVEERRSHKSQLCLHFTGFNHSFPTWLHYMTRNCKSSPQGTLKRRQHLHEAKFFWCICERCKSSDELSTHASTLLCPNVSRCENGFILSSNPLDESAEWR